MIIGFAAFVLVLIWLMMQKTRLGMFVRAVTQNRSMAGCVGVPTARVDTLAFAIGARVAGLGGCALSRIANVGPAMGQGYIVDAFMVVVVGGVGQLTRRGMGGDGPGPDRRQVPRRLDRCGGGEDRGAGCSSSSSSRNGRRDCSPSRDVSSSHEPNHAPAYCCAARPGAAMLAAPLGRLRFSPPVRRRSRRRCISAAVLNMEKHMRTPLTILSSPACRARAGWRWRSLPWWPGSACRWRI